MKKIERLFAAFISFALVSAGTLTASAAELPEQRQEKSGSSGAYRRNNIRYLLCCIVVGVSAFLAGCNMERPDAGYGYDDNDYNDIQTADNDFVSVETDMDTTSQEQEWVYVPERIVIEEPKVDYANMQLVENTVCYISINGDTEQNAQCICRYSLSEKDIICNAIDWPKDENIREIKSYIFNGDYSVSLIVNTYSADYSQLRRFLCKYDSEGKEIFSQDVSEHLGRSIDISSLAADRNGRIYVFTSESEIELFEGDGNYLGAISYDSSEGFQVKGAVEGEDNKLYVCIGNGGDSADNLLLAVDFENRQITEITDDFPSVNGFCADSAGQYDFLLYDHSAVYGYEFSTQKKEPLLVWMDSDINGYFVKDLRVLEDGRYYAVVEDYVNNDSSIVLLTRTRIEEASRRENMVLATVNGGSELNGMVVSFNRNYNQYHLTVKNYDTLTDLYNAILTNESVDIIDLSGCDVEKLSRQDILEDLSPYIEQSDTLERSDFLDGILEMYTFDGILTGIPETFTLRTVVGDRTQLESDAGLSLDELLAIVERNPDALPFDEITKEEMMQYIMMFGEKAFIDWDAKKCYFDSERFKAVLELVNRFPSELRSEQDKVSLPNKIHSGEVLFAIADIDGLKTFQPYAAMFGENAAGIGFPTVDGKGGTLLFPNNAFGIAACSENKNGAWEFIEGVLKREKLEYHEAYRRYFPSLKKILNDIIDMEMERDRQRPSDKYTRRIYEDGLTFTFHAITWDEINVILDMLKEATPSFYVENDEIIKIINEEAGAYYSGQKGIDDVVSIIQNRVRVYVNENG